MNINSQELPHLVVGICLEVHRVLGNGFTASTYQRALAHEFRMQEFSCVTNRSLAYQYKGIDLPDAIEIDLVIEDEIALNVHACDQLRPTHKFQLQTALNLGKLESGFLVNFHARDLRRGIKRIVLNPPTSPLHPFERRTEPPIAAGMEPKGEDVGEDWEESSEDSNS